MRLFQSSTLALVGRSLLTALRRSHNARLLLYSPFPLKKASSRFVQQDTPNVSAAGLTVVFQNRECGQSFTTGGDSYQC